MESLESKLDRLSPDQRREVEDFVDFLMYRSGSPQGIHSQTSINPPVLKPEPPAIPVMVPIVMQETMPLGGYQQNTRQSEPPSLGMSEEDDPPLREITVEVDDRISRDYMDYGQFEQQSPASESIKKVKAKLIQKCDKDDSCHLLDWID